MSQTSWFHPITLSWFPNVHWCCTYNTQETNCSWETAIISVKYWLLNKGITTEGFQPIMCMNLNNTTLRKQIARLKQLLYPKLKPPICDKQVFDSLYAIANNYWNSKSVGWWWVMIQSKKVALWISATIHWWLKKIILFTSFLVRDVKPFQN